MAPSASKTKATTQRRRERTSMLLRRVGSVVGGRVERRIERHLLTQSWKHFEPARLQRYLVRGYQNPVMNVQSILARHELIHEMYGDAHVDLMQAELQWAADRQAAYQEKRRELLDSYKGDYKQLKRSGKLTRAYEQVMFDSDRYATQWTEVLRQPASSRLSVIEAACGSANDYRFFHAYGLAPLIDYTGFDLTAANVENARNMFPGVDFRRGDVQDIPAADGAYDWAITHDLLEHLSPAAFNRAIDELCRVSRRGVLISFFAMGDHLEHQVTPRRYYHVNNLSRQLINDRFAEYCSDIRWIHIRPYVAERTGFSDYYSDRTWTMIARH